MAEGAEGSSAAAARGEVGCGHTRYAHPPWRAGGGTGGFGAG